MSIPLEPPPAPVGIVEQITQALEAANIDAAAGLHAEALELARSGLLGAARDRLRMLLCLDPENGEARLLLAKVFVGQQCWTDALAQLDAVRTLGMQVPNSLQAKVDAGLEAVRDANPAAKLQAELDTATSKLRKARGNSNLWSFATAALAAVVVVAVAIWIFAPAPNPAVINATAPQIQEVYDRAYTDAKAARSPNPTPVPQSGCTGGNNQSWTFTVGNKVVLTAVCHTDSGDEWHACWADGTAVGSFDPNDPSSCVWMPTGS